MGPDAAATRARALAALLGAGGALALASLALPHGEGLDEAAIITLAVVAILAGAVLLALGDRVPPWGVQAVLAGATTLIGAGVYFADDPASFYATFYLWVGTYAFYFLGWREAAAQAAYLAVTYAVVLALVGDLGDSLGRWLLTVGTVVATGVVVSRLVDELRARAREADANARRQRERARDLELLGGVSRDLAGVTTAEATRPAVCAAARAVARASIALLFEPDPSGRELVSTAIAGARRDPIRLPFAGRSGSAAAFSTGRRFFVGDLREDPGVARWLAEDLGVRSALWQPIMRNEASVGVLALAWKEPMPDVSERLRWTLEMLATEAAVAIERANLLARLEAVARTDDLTGLANRRAWEEELPRELARAKREGAPVCVAMLDLDHFKAFNDAHGHQAGDRLLKELAATWRAALRPTDVLARYGGEEFIVALPHCDLDVAIAVVERMRAAMPTDQTCSAGVARWDGEETPEALVSRADRALYDAKHAGRDRSVAAGEARPGA